MRKAGIDRRYAVNWNVVPWYVGSDPSWPAGVWQRRPKRGPAVGQLLLLLFARTVVALPWAGRIEGVCRLGVPRRTELASLTSTSSLNGPAKPGSTVSAVVVCPAEEVK
jgi:hypothetical protein